ncbi:rhodanese-like domain-containing protein [Mesorhizobium sp. J428]|uniref:rhodanese-like domain-containing protein n=1 Tax=Mesorhizobium sp. J428 TaxID=2898440 RepID=UPI00215105BE|nr:rhodanese-like domain-containing protein [Mesorhizobium sp. J428]MCR5856366.1 rhodanese-like domain-containing protein [Mesorhizobium sp. J428]
MSDGAVTVIDVNPPDEYALGHLPGAINVSLLSLRPARKDSTQAGSCCLFPRALVRNVVRNRCRPPPQRAARVQAAGRPPRVEGSGPRR